MFEFLRKKSRRGMIVVVLAVRSAFSVTFVQAVQHNKFGHSFKDRSNHIHEWEKSGKVDTWLPRQAVGFGRSKL